MKRLGLIAALISACTMAIPSQAAQLVLSGQQTHAGIAKLNELSWYHSLGQAEADASRSGKMIFWLHILGQVDGAT